MTSAALFALLGISCAAGAATVSDPLAPVGAPCGRLACRQRRKPAGHQLSVLITTGMNDPRVVPWEPAKLAAALQASGTTFPILLRIDEEAGHGIGSTKTQTDALYADIWAFVFWRAGLREWRPAF